jgi:HK97 family phage prohead protease
MIQKIKGLLQVKENEILVFASDETPDRHGEVIMVGGWELTSFKQNPVLLASHRSQDFPIGKATDISISNGKLIFKAIFSKATKEAREAYELVKEGILNTFSVGFIPREYDEKDGNIITKAELLEISLVSIPANPNAVVIAKSLENNGMAKELVLRELLEKQLSSKDNTSEDVKTSSTEEKVTVEDINLKLVQRTVGYLQNLCKELKRKDGEKK